MQQSKKLREEDERGRDGYLSGPDCTLPGATEETVEAQLEQPGRPVAIRPIQMFNEWVAILQDHDVVEGGIVISKEALARPEGVVVGVPLRQPDAPACQVAVGDRVTFKPRGVLQAFTPAADSDYPYKGKTVVIVSERDLIYKLPPVPVEIIG